MEFRPCIDIHNGKVKQIIGGSLLDDNNQAKENFVSNQDASFFATLYKENNIKGGHIILLNATESDQYEATKKQALSALKAYPSGLQVGGGINADNALEFLHAGATHVIVTSYVFEGGVIHYDNLKKICNVVGKDKLVLDLSCKKKGNDYYIVTNRWQTFTEEVLSISLLEHLSEYCDEFLVHAVDVEGKAEGVDGELIRLLGEFTNKKITYAGGVHNYEDLEIVKKLGKNKVNVTIGSALDLFGGNMEWKKVLDFIKE